MFKHDIREYIPDCVGIGRLYKATIKSCPSEVTRLFAKERVARDSVAEIADRWFLASLLALYGRRAFKRGNLDAGRVNRLFGREIVPADESAFDPQSFDAELRIDVERAAIYFSQMIKQA
jgi:hypothetical protein